jgi:hypothetical protein
MKPGLGFFLLAAAALTGAAAPAAQTRPDLSGRWEISQSKSSPGAIGNGAKISFASELILTQSPGELRVEMRYPRTPDPIVAVYKFDGSETTVTLSEGSTEKAKAAWEGEKLVVTARRVVSTAFGNFITDSKEAWSRAGNVLTIQKTQTSDGLSDNETAIFDLDRP